MNANVKFEFEGMQVAAGLALPRDVAISIRKGNE